jgi:HK97 family phage portal protein
MGLFGRDADMSWVQRFSADSKYEDWLAAPGTGFLPMDVSGYPVAEWSPELRTAFNEPGINSYASIYRSQYAVYTVVEFLAWQISQINIKTYRRLSDTDREHVSKGAIPDLFASPAPGLTYSRFMHRVIADMSVFGSCYCLMLESPGDVKSIVPVPPINVQPRGGNLLEADQYDVTIGAGPAKPFPSEQVLHFRRYNPTDARAGLSPLEPLRAILREEYESSRYRKKLWTKDARMGGFIVRPPDALPMDDDARKSLRSGLDTFSKGGRNEGSWMVLEEGEDPKPIAFSPRDAEFIEGRKLALETVCRAYNIPVAVLGLSQTATYASQREFHAALYRDTLPPYTRMIEDEFMLKLVPWVTGTTTSDIYLEFNLEEKLRGSFEEQAQMLQQAVGGPYMTRNEARARLNLPKVDDPQADELVITNNMIGTETDVPAPPPVVPQPSVVRLPPPQEGAG